MMSEAPISAAIKADAVGEPSTPRTGPYYVLALVLGAVAGFAQVTVQDPTFSALLLVAFCMFLAYMRPRRPWRWSLIVGLCVPAAEFIALLTRIRPTEAMIYGSFVGLLPAFIGALGGSVMRRMVTTLFAKPEVSGELRAKR